MNGGWVFLDKDGTLVQDVPYNADPGKMTFEPGAAEGLRLLAEAGFRLVVVSNQSGVARGYFEEPALEAVWSRLDEMASASAGARFSGFYYCPHHPGGSISPYNVECDCRKPRPGLLLRAARDHGIDLSQAWMVGDILNDVEAGRAAGCRTILIDNGHETEWEPGPRRRPDFMAKDLHQAAEIILAQRAASQPEGQEREPNHEQ